MKAVIWTAYGPPEVLRLEDVEKPVPKDNEVLVKIHATNVTAGDCEMRSMKVPILFRLPMRMYAGWKKPESIKILGHELAGVVEEAGKDVKGFTKGDRVFGTAGIRFGAYAEYICIPEKLEEGGLVTMPAGLSYEEAAAIPLGGLESIHFLRKGNLKSGQTILINGAGGSIGTLAVQLARHMGAEVTAVDSGDKQDMLRSIGADHVIDYSKEDFTKNGKKYDVIFDIAGKSPYSSSLRSIKKNGYYLLANPGPLQMARAVLTSMKGSKKVIIGTAKYSIEDLRYLKELVESGTIKPVIDRHYALEQAVEAHRYVESGHKKGNVVITIDKNGKGALS